MAKLTNKQIEDIFLDYADESVNDELHLSKYAFKEAVNKAFSLQGVGKQRELLETVISELDMQIGTNYSADENLLNKIESSL
jgi:hypothetical protein